MHNNFYFLRQLTTRLDSILRSAVVSECFSQNKDELILRFERTAGSFFIRASLSPSLSCLTFPSDFHRAKKNSIDLFDTIPGNHVTSVTQFDNERSFSIDLTEQRRMLFKMHGNKSNVILFEQDDPVVFFKNNLKGDQAIRLQSLDREVDWSFETFQKNIDKLSSLYFTFGPLVWNYLHEQGFHSASVEEKYKLILATRALLEKPEYLLVAYQDDLRLALLPVGKIAELFHDQLEAINDFYHRRQQAKSFQGEKSAVRNVLNKRLNASRSYVQKTREKLHALEHDASYKMWADLIMANMHTIQPNTESITVENLYDEQKPVQIKLKATLSPQKNAELYYRKAKNQHQEIEHLRTTLKNREAEIGELEEKLRNVDETDDSKAVKRLAKEVLSSESTGKPVSLPYHEFVFNGFRIWVGKTAEHNDTLTLHLGYKEDLWLHAKDVPGSHVLIKHQSGKKFPKDVIERAAQLAAWNSKRKNDTLCPVIVTPKKFVRKRKGDPAGMVVVEKEDVVMVVPKL